jgi:cyclopropane fatty-acyl-phospholipid synthase-like methyltransferase
VEDEIMMKKMMIALSVLLIAVPLAVRVFFWEEFKAVFYIHDMESDGRVARLQVERVIGALELRPGETAADIGSGTGLFTVPIARAVGKTGTVYAIDINRALLEHVGRLAKREGLGGVKTVAAREDDPLLPELVDLIFICDTFHYVGDRVGYLKKLKGYLKPGGRLAVIDLKDKWPPFHEQYRFTVAELKAWASEAGFRVIAEHDFLADEFFIVFAPK